ncbi:N(4)-(Beta-N-acetylglucosaminyl)-L-asparaginase [Sitodiplosis mosellana]|uniref:N(4)-(Beta-N-acetylglucosaminyl)-L-asparaginase n=1 Tax=Sitodiplosis mosellana TaxID=263140 RepID=UPI0024443DF7|nr:N(4)-(Beta-N-acetylglucosaminyl)-L-asparaginase [Sitodiplosis mosellana]
MKQFVLIALFNFVLFVECKNVPIVINTWNFSSATAKAWEVIQISERTAIDAVVEGCAVCERERCDGTVGYGGSPDEKADVALDALLIDGKTMSIGAVGSMRNIKNAIGVARRVLENTQHTLLVGEGATDFAIMMGFKNESLTTEKTQDLWKQWKSNRCQPNFWTNVEPDPTRFCGPYEPTEANSVYSSLYSNEFNSKNHDTIGMIAIDSNGDIAAGTSTNGARYKIPGRVGDSPIPGSGAYAENGIGAAAATGDGDVMMRFLPSFVAVEGLRHGYSPKKAAQSAFQRIQKFHPKFFGGIIVVNQEGEYAAACNGMESFPFSIGTKDGGVRIESVPCLSPTSNI